MKKYYKKQLALQLVINLIDDALFKPDLFVDDHISIAKKIIFKYKVKLPFEYKILFCKNCKRFIIPGKNSTIRLGRSSVKALRVTCRACGHTYRKIIKSKI